MYKILMSIFLWTSFTPLSAQEIIWHESFETDGAGNRYVTSSSFYDGSQDYFIRTDGSEISIIGTAYAAYEGQYFWAGEDLDDIGDPANDGLSTKIIYFDTIKTSSYTSLTFSGLFAAGHNGGAGAGIYDDEDSVVVYYSIDGGSSFLPGLKFASTGDLSNEPIAWDTNFDGIGDSTVLAPSMTGFSFSIADADSVIIKISVSMNAGSEEFAFDNFQLSGTHNGIDPLPTKASFLFSSDTVSENSFSFSLPVQIQNPTDTVEIRLEVTAGDTSKILSFDKELFLTGIADTILYTNIYLKDNELLDGDTKLTFSLVSIYGGYNAEITEPSQFILFIKDDDVPAGGEVIISEIMYDSWSSTDEEWVELHNTTDNPINISGWYLTDDDSYPADAEGDVVFPDSTIISAGEYLVFSWKTLSDYPDAMVLDKNSGFRSYAPGLANTGDNLALYSGTGILVDGSDSIMFDDGSPANAGYSIERDVIGGYAGEWKASVNSFNGSEIVKGTPGVINSTFYTSLSFDILHKLVSEDSAVIKIPVGILNFSDTTATYCTIELINGDSLEITSPASQDLIFPSGSPVEQYFTIEVADDPAVAKTDTLIFQIRNISGGNRAYKGADSVFQLIINDNDFTKVNFGLDSVEMKEGDSLKVDLVLDNPHPYQHTSVTFADTLNDLTIPSEYIFVPGTDTASIWIKATYDGIEEGDEFIFLNFSSITGGNYAAAGADSILVIKIKDDNPTQISFEDSVGYASEADDYFHIPVGIGFPSMDSATTATIKLVKGDSIDLNGFYETSITFNPGDSAIQYLQVPIDNDQVRENKEEFVFQITVASGGNRSIIGEADIFKLIINDDEQPAKLLVINEILYDPPADTILGDANGDGIRHSSQDEFLEIVNNDTLAVDLSGFTINDAAKTRHVFPAGTVLNPDQPIVIFGGGAPAGDFGGSLVQIASSGGLSLNNTGDAIYLINATDTINIVIYSGDIGSDKSITRYPDVKGDFMDHLTVSEKPYSPGFQSIGLLFDEEWPVPVITIDTTSFNNDFGLVYYPDTSKARSYGISIKDLLMDSLFIRSPLGFKISTDEQTWSDRISIINSDSIVIYVSFIPVSSDTIIYDNFILHYTSTSDTLKLKLNGEGRKKPAPVISLSSALADFGAVAYQKDVEPITYNITGAELTDTVYVYAPPGFTVSADGVNFNDTLSLKPDQQANIDTTLYVNFQVDVLGKYSANIKHLTQNADTVDFFVFGEFLKPEVTANADSINYKEIIVGDTSEFLLNISAGSLIDSLVIKSSGEFEISAEGNLFSNKLALNYDSLRKIDRQVKIRFAPNEEDIFIGSLIFSSYGADSLVIPLEGTGIQPEIIISDSTIDLGITNGSEYLISSYNIKGISLVDTVRIAAPAEILLSATEDFSSAKSELEFYPSNEKTLDAEIFIGFKSSEALMVNSHITHFTAGLDSLRIKVMAEKVISELDIDEDLLIFNETPVGDISNIGSFQIKGSSILDPIQITAPAGFEIDSESYFNSPNDTITLFPDSRSIERSIYIRFIPASEGEINDSLKISGTGFEDAYLKLEGTAYTITGLEDQDNQDITVFPVPADKYLFVQINDETKEYSITLFTSSGVLIKNLVVTGNVAINTADLQPGIYHLVISDGAKDRSFKILVAH
ncbi:MAG: lamin tail domain-containing protein [Candidatus Cyclobacteriaceae bacterium M2_1C_046]